MFAWSFEQVGSEQVRSEQVRSEQVASEQVASEQVGSEHRVGAGWGQGGCQGAGHGERLMHEQGRSRPGVAHGMHVKGSSGGASAGAGLDQRDAACMPQRPQRLYTHTAMHHASSTSSTSSTPACPTSAAGVAPGWPPAEGAAWPQLPRPPAHCLCAPPPSHTWGRRGV